jgi:hypothetical protein
LEIQSAYFFDVSNIEQLAKMMSSTYTIDIMAKPCMFVGVAAPSSAFHNLSASSKKRWPRLLKSPGIAKTSG